MKKIYCLDCKEELIAEQEDDTGRSIRCPECWAKMEEETDLEDDKLKT